MSGTSAAQLKLIGAAMSTRLLRARQSLSLARDLSQRVAFVAAGRARVVSSTPDGAAITLDILEAGGILGLTMAVLNRTPGSGVRIVADCATTLLHLDAQTFLTATKACPTLCHAVMRHLAMQNIRFATRAYDMSALDVRTRLQGELVRLAEAAVWLDGQRVINPAPTHATLAAHIGATREAVSRNLSELEREGMITRHDRAIGFVDLDRMREVAAATAEQMLFRERDDDA